MAIRCVSCDVDISTIKNSIVFKCPKCGAEIARCGTCRKRGISYICPTCGFEGP